MTTITADQALSTAEQLEDMTSNEGVNLTASFDITLADFYGICSMMNLTAHTPKEGDAEKQAMWNPNKRLTIILHGHL